MQSAIATTFGMHPALFHWVVVPLLIFLARICDVSINTIRVIFMLSGRKGLSTFLGFFESFIWLMAISQILQNVDNVASYFAYAGGFAGGIFVGMKIEERLAIGNIILRIISPPPADELISSMISAGYGVTSLDAQGARGTVKIIFTVARRQKLNDLIALINRHNPNAFYTIEGVKHVNEAQPFLSVSDSGRFSLFRNFMRK